MIRSRRQRGMWHRVSTRACRIVSALFASLVLAGCDSDIHLSFLDPQGPIAAAERTHFLWVVAILLVFVALPIFVLVPWLAWRYRHGNHKARYTPRWKAWLPLELATWIGPIIIVIVLGVLLWRTAHELDPYTPVRSDAEPVRVQAISYDWKWLFIYPDKGVASVGKLAIPAGRPVSMQLTSATVMQSLQIPSLVSQIYTMGGMVTQLHFQADRPGRFLGENNMYNGDGFHTQKFDTVAMSAADFRQWVHDAQQRGVTLTPSTYARLQAPGTEADLARQLSSHRSPHGGIQFRNVTPDLFARVVKATKNNPAGASSSVAAPGAGEHSISVTNQGDAAEATP